VTATAGFNLTQHMQLVQTPPSDTDNLRRRIFHSRPRREG